MEFERREVTRMREKVRNINFAKTGKNSDSTTRGMMPRRLAAIVAGDIAGYSRLMELDEEGTHARVKLFGPHK